jgi:putative Ca2+/H+ antiporter (TMEM165/GDT1 family)
MEAFLVSLSMNALTEIADISQLVAFVMALRWGRFWPVISGVLLASSLNHIGSHWIPETVNFAVPSSGLKASISIVYLVAAVLILIAERKHVIANNLTFGRIVLQTTLLFALAEFGDRSYTATQALMQQFGSGIGVHAGSSLGIASASCLVAFPATTLLQRLPDFARRYCIPLGLLIVGLLNGIAA